MECNIETVVRVYPVIANTQEVCLHSNCYNNTVQLGTSQVYSVNCSLPIECSQNAVFSASILPLVNYLLEGCDVSVVTIGQIGTGKSYTLLGPLLNCSVSESEFGIIPRFLREVFSKTTSNNERTLTLHISWTQICGETIQDLLGTGSIECFSVAHAFELFQMGMSNIAPQGAHTLFTLTLEQQWVADGLIQHRISTASFADLRGCEKMYSFDANGFSQIVPAEPGLLALQKCIWNISNANYLNTMCYTQSTLTTLLKDSFGGRAKTVLIGCVSPLLKDYIETYYTLQFLLKAQQVKNYVTVNSYTTLEASDTADMFGLQFAANQLLKLVANAEDLFKSLVINNNLSKGQVEQIAQWLTLKQECEECISDSSEQHHSLERIDEEIEESDEEESEAETEANVEERLEELLQTFRTQTDDAIAKINRANASLTTRMGTSSGNSEFHDKGARGRRNSVIFPSGFSTLLPKSPVVDSSENPNVLKELKTSSHSDKKKLLKQIVTEIEGYEKQITELEQTIDSKETLMHQLQTNRRVKHTARGRMSEKCEQLKCELDVLHTKLEQAHIDQDMALERQYQDEIDDTEQRIKDAEVIKSVTDINRKVMELEGSLHTSRKQLDKLKKCKRREEKERHECENDLKLERSQETSQDLKVSGKSSAKTSTSSSNWITKYTLGLSDSNEDVETVKHEIKELRRTRECLLEQKCKIDTRLHHRLLNDSDEQRLLQYDEAVEAIDFAIEFKNQRICGSLTLAASTFAQQEADIERMLMERFRKLNCEEMRALLQRYFEKVVDLRGSSKKLELQMIEAETQNESLLYRLQSMSHTLQQLRLEGERRIITLQQQHEDNLHLVMRHLAREDGDGEQMVARVMERSKQAALSLQVAQRKQVSNNKGSLIAKFTRYARQETVPRQLQAAATQPQAKVTRQKNKLIIQQNNK